MKKSIEKLKKVLNPDKKSKVEKLGLSTGSTVLNCACSDDPLKGFLSGHYYRFVGDSSSGKTFLCMTCLAEAVNDPKFDKYRLIYDDVEGGALMDITKFFGSKLAKRIEPPRKKKGVALYSQNIEELYYHIDDAVEEGGPFIYIVDSMDFLS